MGSAIIRGMAVLAVARPMAPWPLQRLRVWLRGAPAAAKAARIWSAAAAGTEASSTELEGRQSYISIEAQRGSSSKSESWRSGSRLRRLLHAQGLARAHCEMRARLHRDCGCNVAQVCPHWSWLLNVAESGSHWRESMTRHKDVKSYKSIFWKLSDFLKYFQNSEFFFEFCEFIRLFRDFFWIFRIRHLVIFGAGNWSRPQNLHEPCLKLYFRSVVSDFKSSSEVTLISFILFGITSQKSRKYFRRSEKKSENPNWFGFTEKVSENLKKLAFSEKNEISLFYLLITWSLHVYYMHVMLV
jgi:hypothetical protein